MNFFKSLTTSKVTKKETAAPAAIKDQVAQVSEPPAAPKGMSIPPPPPPEPPKMDIKAEPAKPVKPTTKEDPKAVARQPESSKGKSAKVTLSKMFRSKTNKESPTKPDTEVEVQHVVEVEETPVEAPQPVVVDVKVDSSKASTLEAAVKPEPPPPVQETKKTASTPSFFSLFKAKAADPKKASPAPAAGAETVKAKEEPKAAAKSSEAVADNKPASVASQAAGDAANAPKKVEKRNSIHQFFKILGQKRNSTDAGIQTETLAVAPAPEKVK
ncbi:breast carcinoma-amplified sequence 1 isoform 2-T2 [Spinachia spinachia]